jgi:Transcriptional regulator LmrA/YxaF-like, C-terminal domain
LGSGRSRHSTRCRDARTAQDLAELCIAGLEGAIILARVDRSPDNIDRIQRQLDTLLATPPTKDPR